MQNGLKYIIETYRCQVMSKYQLYILVGLVMRTVMKKKTEGEEEKTTDPHRTRVHLGFIHKKSAHSWQRMLKKYEPK